MMQPLSKEFGWTTAELSSVFSVRFALFGLLGPFAAILDAAAGGPPDYAALGEVMRRHGLTCAE